MRTSTLLLVVFLAATAIADDAPPSPASQLNDAARKATAKKYDLRYKFEKDETIRWRVSHLATTQTKIKGNSQTSQSRSLSTKAWKVTEVDQDGNMTFTHTVEDVEMWQRVGDQAPLEYNSRSDEKPPIIYEAVADTVGKPLATVTIDPHGQIVERDGNRPSARIGLGQITMPLPVEPIKIGESWYWPDTVAIRLQDKRVKQVKIRHKYELTGVEGDVAAISIDTEVLSVINDASERSQLVQQLIHGQLRFDIAAGRLVSKQVDWDETVIGFNGEESIMNYVARFTEELDRSQPRTAAKPVAGPPQE